MTASSAPGRVGRPSSTGRTSEGMTTVKWNRFEIVVSGYDRYAWKYVGLRDGSVRVLARSARSYSSRRKVRRAIAAVMGTAADAYILDTTRTDPSIHVAVEQFQRVPDVDPIVVESRIRIAPHHHSHGSSRRARAWRWAPISAAVWTSEPGAAGADRRPVAEVAADHALPPAKPDAPSPVSQRASAASVAPVTGQQRVLGERVARRSTPKVTEASPAVVASGRGAAASAQQSRPATAAAATSNAKAPTPATTSRSRAGRPRSSTGDTTTTR